MRRVRWALPWRSVSGVAIDEAADRLIATRPTATNLAWGVRRARNAADAIEEAIRIAAEDVEVNRRLGAHGAALIDDGARVLTHCNAGALACVGYGTAIGVIRAAHEAGKRVTVWVDETRPVLQGSRLTAWELQRLAIPCTIVPDALAGSLMAADEVDAVVVGADRIAANGDVANKVGTYPLAVLANHHGVPFYVAAPRSTFDDRTPSVRRSRSRDDQATRWSSSPGNAWRRRASLRRIAPSTSHLPRWSRPT